MIHYGVTTAGTMPWVNLQLWHQVLGFFMNYDMNSAHNSRTTLGLHPGSVAYCLYRQGQLFTLFEPDTPHL